MQLDNLIAIDVHTHAEVSCRQEPDEAWQPFEAAAELILKQNAIRALGLDREA